MNQLIVDTLQTRLQRDDIDVPLLPEVVSKVIRLTQDPDSVASDLARLIQSDQPLAGQVMRIASSAMYSPNTTLVSLQQAIARLGMRIISDIALAASVSSKMFNAPGYDQFIAQQLKYSLHSGLWAKEVARLCRRNVEVAFLSGLLHNIGRPVAIQVILETALKHRLELTKEEVLELATRFERPLSVKVVQFWNMPRAVCDVVGAFDHYQTADAAKEPTMIVVAGARLAAHFTKVGGKPMLSREDLLKDEVFSELNIYLEDLHELLEKADMVTTTLESMSA